VIAAIAALALAPTLKYRWFYVQTNFFVEESVAKVSALLKRAAKAGYNGMAFTDSKLESLDPYPDFYVKRVKGMLAEAKSLHIDVIPFALSVGWADGLLSKNPNLVEAMPLKNVPFLVHGKEAQVAPDPEVRFENGDFETADGDKFSGFAFQDGIGKSTFADHQTVHGGHTAIRMENPGAITDTSGNCRIMRRVKVRPGRHYEYAAWAKSQDFASAGSVRMAVLDAKGRSLSFEDVPVQRTMDWTPIHVTFDSLDDEEVYLYVGVWGGTTGKMWWDDIQLTELGLTNLVRRPGCPVTVVGENGMTYEEGRDFEKIEDPKSGQIPWPGEYEVSHPSPPIKLTANSRIQDGQRLKVSFSHALMTESGKTALCLSELASRALEDREITKIAELFGPEKLFFAHDEIRVMNWCQACQNRRITPGKMLAEDLMADSKTARRLAPHGEQFVWSDMFDPAHNAVASYYMVNGDLSGSWAGLPKDMVVVNWNSGQAEKSLSFFSKLGNPQILAGYYDAPVGAIKDWMAKGKSLPGIVGVMYTTWQDKYDDLEAFAKAAWGDTGKN